MRKERPVPTKESRIVAAAVAEAMAKDPTLTKARLAEQAGVSAGMLYQWETGMRPVAPERAARAAQALSIEDPATISVGYAESLANAIGANALALAPAKAGRESAPADLAIARLQNDVHALSVALGVMTAVMVAHRPAEAQAVAAAVRRKVPAKWKDQGLIRELLEVLDKAG
jgi:transcriptional regulator with XRE-family HTH domain